MIDPDALAAAFALALAAACLILLAGPRMIPPDRLKNKARPRVAPATRGASPAHTVEDCPACGGAVRVPRSVMRGGAPVIVTCGDCGGVYRAIREPVEE